MNDGRHCVGYVFEDVCDSYWKVELTTNQIINLKYERFKREKGTYTYHNYNGSTGCVIKYYWPIRIFIHTSGHGYLTMNRLVQCMDNDSISIVQFI